MESEGPGPRQLCADYRADQPGLFISCPGDVKVEAQALKSIFERLPVPGPKRKAYYWPEEINIFAQPGGAPTQYQIAQTASANINPVFVILGERVGTPAPQPPDGGWQPLKQYLTSRGWQDHFAFVGDDDFPDILKPPAEKIPVTGTIYEILEALRTGSQTSTWIILLDTDRARRCTDLSEHERREAERQWAWRQKFASLLQGAHTTIAGGAFPVREITPETFPALAEHLLRNHFAGHFDPLRDELPGLAPITARRRRVLFGRGEEISDATGRLLDKYGPAYLLVTGVRGVGKSSFLRAGLQGALTEPGSPGFNRGVTVMAAEPRALQALGDGDPLLGLGRALGRGPERGDVFAAPDDHPHAFPAPVVTPETLAPPPLDGERRRNLEAALDWWERVIEIPDHGALIVLIDQAEQVEAIAREELDQRENRPSGRDDDEHDDSAVELSLGWQRLTDLLALLSGEADPQCLDDNTLRSRAESLRRERDVRLVMSVHRESTMEFWPFRPVEQLPSGQRLRLTPMTRSAQWRDVIAGTVQAYGLAIEAELCDHMAREAEDLAKVKVLSGPMPDQSVAEDRDHDATSVMPQVMAALQVMLETWRGACDQTERFSDFRDVDRTLHFNDYASCSGIEGVIDRIGESVWHDWLSQLMATRGLDRLGPLSQHELSTQQDAAFNAVLGALTQFNRNRVEPNWCPVDAPVLSAPDPSALVAVLRRARLVTSQEGRYVRLAHSSVFHSWQRAARWIEGNRDRLRLHRRLEQDRDNAELDGLDEPTDFANRIDDYTELYFRWPGSRSGEDARLRTWLRERLVQRFDPHTDPRQGERPSERLFRMAVRTGDDELLAALIDRISAAAPSLTTARAGVWLSMLCVLPVERELRTRYYVDELLQAHPQAVDHVDVESGTFPLLMAAENGHAPVVETLLAQGADPDRMHEQDGTFPLLLAAQNGHAPVVETLLAQGADPERMHEQDGTFPLLLAAREGHTTVVEALLTQRADPNRVHEQTGIFPLLVAAREGYAPMVEVLLAHGAEPDRMNEQDGNFPLLLAVEQGRAPVVEALLAHGADPDRMNERNGTFPLLQAAQNGHTPVVEALLAQGIDPDRIHERTGRFPLFKAAQNGHAPVVEALLAHGADPDRMNEQDGTFPLLMAAHKGHTPVVEALLAHGAEPDRRNEQDGNFPLQLAVEQGRAPVVEALLVHGADPDRIDEQNAAFLLLQAAQNGQTPVVEALLAHGVDPNRVHEQSGTFPLLLAAKQGRAPMVESLLAYGAESERINEHDGNFPVLLAAQDGHVSVVEVLLAQGADPDLRNELTGTFPLLLAAEHGSAPVVQALLAHGVEVDQISEQNGTFPLLLAAQNGHAPTVQALLIYGAEVDRINQQNGAFPLLVAAHCGHTPVVEALLAQGADPNRIHEQTGVFPLLLAARKGYAPMAKALLAQGAAPDRIHEQTGTFSLLEAAENGHVPVMEALVDAGAIVNLGRPADRVTALDAALGAGRLASADSLIARGGKPTRALADTDTALFTEAGYQGLPRLLWVLIEGGVRSDSGEGVGRYRAPWPPAWIADLPWRGLDDRLDGQVRTAMQALGVEEMDAASPMALSLLGGELDLVRVPVVDAGEPAEVLWAISADGLAPLAGHSEALVRLAHGLGSASSENLALYRKLLAAVTTGPDGLYAPVESEADVPLSPGADPALCDRLREALESLCQASDTDSTQPAQVTAILRGTRLQRALLQLDEDGRLHLRNEQTLLADLPLKSVYRVAVQVPACNEPEPTSEPLSTSDPAPIGFSMPTPRDSVPGPWREGDPASPGRSVPPQLERWLTEGQGRLEAVTLEETLLGSESIRLRRMRTVWHRDDGFDWTELYWLALPDGGYMLDPRAGLRLLDDLFREAAHRPNWRVDFRDEEMAQRLAALMLMLSGPAVHPLQPGADLPVTAGVELPSAVLESVAQGSPWVWGMHGNDGPALRLPWIAGRKLLYGQVLVPQDGCLPDAAVERRIMEQHTLVGDGDFEIPYFLADGEGGYLPLRVLPRSWMGDRPQEDRSAP